MGSNLYNQLEMTPLINDALNMAQLSLPPFCVDQSMMFHLPPEVSPFPQCQDMTLVSYVDSPGLEYYYSNIYSLPPPPTCPIFGNSDGYYEPSYIRKRNERERQRVKCVNEGYTKLQRHLPQEYKERRLSKVQTLRAAIRYIYHLQEALQWEQSEGSRVVLQQHGKTTNSNNCQRSNLCDLLKRSSQH